MTSDKDAAAKRWMSALPRDQFEHLLALVHKAKSDGEFLGERRATAAIVADLRGDTWQREHNWLGQEVSVFEGLAARYEKGEHLPANPLDT